MYVLFVELVLQIVGWGRGIVSVCNFFFESMIQKLNINIIYILKVRILFYGKFKWKEDWKIKDIRKN